ncbi:MAG: alanine racemase [Planctomycetes bacterium]|nr:alanine racemase [Planctomycetota bacterium]
MPFLHPRAFAEIDLSAYRHNLRAIMKFIGPDASVAAVLKADAYGHSAKLLAPEAEAAGSKYVVVADTLEAIEVREAGVTIPVLILGKLIPGEWDSLAEYDLTPTIHSREELSLFENVAARRGARLKAHFKVNTGMNRLGLDYDEAFGVIEAATRGGRIEVEGIYSHFSSAESDEEYSRLQLERFTALRRMLSGAGIEPKYFHNSNSFGISRYGASGCNLVRPGLATYGCVPDLLSKSHGKEFELRPVLSLRSQIIHLRDVRKGASIGYDRTHVAGRDSVIATLSIGYHDGVPRSVSNVGSVLVLGERAPVVGLVTMDYTLVDVTDVEGVRTGDLATIIGVDGERSIGIRELAKTAGTIPYELTTRLGRRVARIPRGGASVRISKRSDAKSAG